MVKFPSEKFLLPVSKFNDSVGPLFAELRTRFPLDEHHDSGLKRSLGLFLNYCFVEALEKLMELRPVPLSREDWMKATTEEKAVHMLWQENLAYLKRRLRHYIDLMKPVAAPKKKRKSRFDDYDVI